jgi:tRNA(adenine34) deaminase
MTEIWEAVMQVGTVLACMEPSSLPASLSIWDDADRIGYEESAMNNPYMEEAIKEAWIAYQKGEVPVGAVLVRDGTIITRAHNLRESKHQAVAHAELLAIQEACIKLGSWRLEECDLYVTLEPCPMCAGAIINSRIKTVYFGAYDSKGGACGSVVDLFKKRSFNHSPEVYAGIMEDACEEPLKEFFKRLR